MNRTSISSRLRVLGGIAIVSASLLSACGSSSKSDSSSATTAASAADGTLSKSDFVSQANGMCKDMGGTFKTTQAAMKTSTDSKDPKIAADALGTAVTELAAMRAKVAAMKAPSDGDAAQKALVSMLDQFGVKFQADKTALENIATGGTGPSADDLAKFQKDIEATTKPIGDYGISC